RNERDLLISKRADLPAINGDHADRLVFLEHGYRDQGPDAAELDPGNRHWVAVEVGLVRAQISDVDRLPSPGGAGRGCRAVTDHGAVRRLRRTGPWRATTRMLSPSQRNRVPWLASHSRLAFTG